MDTTTENERRQSPRYALRTDVFLAFRPDFITLGKLKDISNGGVALEYAVFEKYEEVVDAEVDIFTSEPDRFMLSRVPCRVVYDTKTQKPTPLWGMETRRCGLKFEHLSHQQSELNRLIINCMSHRLPNKQGPSLARFLLATDQLLGNLH